MNKIIFLFLICHSASAFAAKKTQIEITTTNNLKFKTSYQIIVDKNNLYFNSEKIDPVQFPILLPSLRTLSKVKPERSGNCYAGTFTHTVIMNKKVTKTTGCLNSKRADQLLIGIEKFKKSKIL